MTQKRRFLRVAHLLFLVLLLVQIILPDTSAKETNTGTLIAFAAGLEILTLAVSLFIKKEESLSLLLDIVGFIYAVLTVWSLATAKFHVLNDLLFPAPGRVLAQFAEDRQKILVNIVSSVGITLQGFLLAAAAAIPLGLFLGWNARLGGAATYITKFFSSYLWNVHLSFLNIVYNFFTNTCYSKHSVNYSLNISIVSKSFT